MIKPIIIKSIFLFIIFLSSPNLYAQENTDIPVAPTATAKWRKALYEQMINYTIPGNMGEALDSDTEDDWSSAFWGQELMLYKSDFVRKKLQKAFKNINDRSIDFQRRLLELVYTNYPHEYYPQVKKLMAAIQEPKIFAMCAEYILRANHNKADSILVHSRLHQLILQHNDDAILEMLAARLATVPQVLPPLKDILSRNFVPGYTIMYSFQRNDRDYPGLAIIRKPDGTFAKDSTGNIIAVPQLARAINKLPFYLTNGNTPQGIFTISGLDTSTSSFIGPTANIQLSLPFEISVDSFYHITPLSPELEDTNWTIEKYAELLPQSWKNYVPVYHSFYAGKAGRTAIIAHGTTINPDYYKDQIYYPETPSLGCLCAYENWSPETGLRLQSDQQQLVNAFLQAQKDKGYCVVLELNNKKAPVKLKDILPAIQTAEKE